MARISKRMLPLLVEIQRFDRDQEENQVVFSDIPAAIGRSVTDSFRDPQGRGTLVENEPNLYVNILPRAGFSHDPAGNKTVMGKTDKIDIRLSDFVFIQSTNQGFEIDGVNDEATLGNHFKCPLKGIQSPGAPPQQRF